MVARAPRPRPSGPCAGHRHGVPSAPGGLPQPMSAAEPHDIESPGGRPAGGTLRQPRAVVARVRRAGARARREPGPADPRARAVPRDLQREPRRVLPDPGRRPEGAGERRHPVHLAGRDGARRAARADRRPREGALERGSTACGPGRSSRGCAKAGIRVEDWDDLDDAARLFLREVYEERLYPILTPLSVDPSHPFPYISNLSLNLALMVRPPGSGMARFARVKVPPSLPRFLGLPDGERFVLVEQVIAAYIEDLFPGMEIVATYPFRVTRDADIELEIDEAEDLLSQIESILRQRERSPEVVRLEVPRSMPKAMRALLREELVARRPRRRRLAVAARARRPRASSRRSTAPTCSSSRGRRRRRARLQPVVAGRTDIFAVLRARRRARAPPLRRVRHVGRAVRGTGVPRPEGDGDQADAVPDLGAGLGDRALARPRRRGGQAGRRAGGAHGAVRRRGEHDVGPHPGAGGRPRRVRGRRPEDAREGLARGARRRRHRPALLPRRHRQLPRGHGADLRGPRAAHRPTPR